MKTIFNRLLIFLFMFLIAGKTYAIDAPINLKMDSNTETSVNLSWDKVENAFMYYVYYSNESGIYDNVTDLIEGNSFEIKGLDPKNTYYFSVVSLDEDAVESEYSKELVIDMSNLESNEPVIKEEKKGTENKENMSNNFSIQKIEALANNKIKLQFNSELENKQDSIREFKITNTKDAFDEYFVSSSEVSENDTTSLILNLDRDLVLGDEYKVVVIYITNTLGETIESGIDSSELFLFNEIVEEVEFNSAVEEEKVEEVIPEKVETTMTVSKETEKLPTTGPERIFLLIVSIILGAFLLIFRNKKA